MDTLSIDPRLVPAQLDLLLGRPPVRGGWRLRTLIQRIVHWLRAWQRAVAASLAEGL